MKHTLTTLMLAVGLGSLFAATPVLAQSSNPSTAEVPFAFVVSGQTLPAGKYDFSQFDGQSSLFMLRNQSGKAILAQFGARETGHPENPSVTFVRAGGEWVLVKITPPNSLTAYALGQDALEKNKKLQLAAMIAIKLK